MKQIKKKESPLKNKSVRLVNPNPDPTFLDHLLEFRIRVTISILSIIAFSILGYLLRETLIKILLMPFGGTLYYLSPTGGFDFIISVCLVFGFLLSIPVVFYEFMRFVLPAFPKLPKVSIIFFSILSFILMAVGVGFAYFISLPAAFNFLEKFGNTSLKSLISADLFLSFVIHYVFGFGILFELPLVILIINKIYRLSIRNLLGFERWVILLSSIFAAILTPTSDIVNMAIMAVPIIVLYQLSILLVAVVNTKNHVS